MIGDKKKNNKPIAKPIAKPIVPSYIASDVKVGDQCPFSYIALGCGGTGKQEQKDVALALYNALKKMKSAGKPLPKFIALLGDNVYDYGASSPEDKAFDACFHNIYDKITKEFGIPFLAILGNHGYNYHSVNFSWIFGSGIELAMNQVKHTFSKANHGKCKVDYRKSSLALSELPSWNMPHRFYKLVIGNQHFFFLDSNSYVQEWAVKEYCKQNNKELKPGNQAAWLEKEFKQSKEKGAEITFFQHHPLYTVGKRANPKSGSDLGCYVKSEAVKKYLNTQLSINTKSNYHDILEAIFRKQKFLSAEKKITVVSAHDHSMCVYNTPEVYQVISGGAGGPVQKEFFARTAEIMKSTALSTAQHGYALVHKNNEVVSDKKYKKPVPDLEIIETRTGKSYFFRKGVPQLHCKADGMDLTTAVLTACNKYLVYVSTLGYNVKHGSSGVERALRVRNTLLNSEKITKESLFALLNKEFKSYDSKPPENSLCAYIKKELKSLVTKTKLMKDAKVSGLSMFATSSTARTVDKRHKTSSIFSRSFA